MPTQLPPTEIGIFTTKDRVSLYSGVPAADINDIIIEDAESWVIARLTRHGINYIDVTLPDDELRSAATFYSVYLLSKQAGGKAWKINSMEHGSSSVGELSESLNSPQFTRDELPTTDWYGLAQRSMDDFLQNAIDETKMNQARFKAVSASTTDGVGTPYRTTGNEEYGFSPRFGARTVRRR